MALSHGLRAAKAAGNWRTSCYSSPPHSEVQQMRINYYDVARTFAHRRRVYIGLRPGLAALWQSICEHTHQGKLVLSSIGRLKLIRLGCGLITSQAAANLVINCSILF